MAKKKFGEMNPTRGWTGYLLYGDLTGTRHGVLALHLRSYSFSTEAAPILTASEGVLTRATEDITELRGLYPHPAPLSEMALPKQ
jgi:hypothetical protein